MIAEIVFALVIEMLGESGAAGPVGSLPVQAEHPPAAVAVAAGKTLPDVSVRPSNDNPSSAIAVLAEAGPWGGVLREEFEAAHAAPWISGGTEIAPSFGVQKG